MTTSGCCKKHDLIDLLKVVGGRYRETPVVLGTGEKTHVYLDVKGVLDRGSRLNLAADALYSHIWAKVAEPHRITAIGGPTMGADVLSHTISSRDDDGIRVAREWKWFSVRDKAKTSHGLGRWIEGAELDSADGVILTDDVANSGNSLIEAYGRIYETGARVMAVVPLVDRSDQTAPKFAELGIPYIPLLTSADLGLEPLKAQ